MELLILTLNIIGSLGLFLYGMKIMSEALQRVAGDGLRHVMRTMAATPISQIVTTGAITATVQSSSAITVMIVSLVNASIITLRQSIGMIFGANIGTTITAWIVAIFGFGLNLSIISIPMIGLGFAFILIRGNNRYRNVGEITVGFALLLLAISLLSSSMSTISSNTALFEALGQYADLGFLSIIIFVVIGTLLTALLQSSSATITITIIMCQSGWIPLDAALAMIVGENIGTTLTANVAAIVANTAAKRAALSHTLINTLGMIWVVPMLPWIGRGLQMLWGEWGVGTTAAVPLMLAMFHTLYNIANCCILVGFTNQIVSLVTRMIPQSAGDNRKRLFALDSGLVSTPELSILQAHNEISNHAKRTMMMFRLVRSLPAETNQQEFDSTYARIEKYRDITDRVEREIITYLARLTGGNHAHATTLQLQSMFRTILYLEMISDINMEIAKILHTKRENNLWFNQDLRDKLNSLFDLCEQGLYVMIQAIDNPSAEALQRCGELRDQISQNCHILRNEQLGNIESAQYKYIAGVAFIELVSQGEKMADAIQRMAQQQQSA